MSDLHHFTAVIEIGRVPGGDIQASLVFAASLILARSQGFRAKLDGFGVAYGDVSDAECALPRVALLTA